MDEVKRCFGVLARLSECGKAPVKNSRFDVVSEVTKALEEALSDADFDLSLEVSSSPSTSQPDDQQQQLPDDPRIRLGRLLAAVYSKLSSSLVRCKEGCDDEFTILSVQEQALISASLQFFVLAQILPYVEEGVGIPISKRSAYVKSWTRLTTDVHLQKRQLLSGLDTLHELISSNAALQPEILKSFLADIVCANEQLLSLGQPPLDWLEELFTLLPKTLFISSLLALSKTYDRTKPPPAWFTNSLGKRLSDILCSEDGLQHTLSSYLELGGSQFWENSHLLCCIGRQLAVPPKGRKRMAYYENICKQFQKLIYEGPFPKEGVAELFSTFVDEMTRRESFAAEVLVLDVLFKQFETLVESSPETHLWSSSMSRSLILLALLADDRICPKALANSPRIMELFPLFLGFLMSPAFDEEVLPADFKSLSEDLTKILRFLAKKVENMHDLLISFVLSNQDYCYTIHYKKALISIVGESSSDVEIRLQRVRSEDKEEMVMKKLDAVLKFIKMLDSSHSSRLLIEILSRAVKMWNESVSPEADAPRFVAPDDRDWKSDPEWIRLASHLVALFCFEQLGEWDVDPTNPSVVEAIAKLIQAVLSSTIEWNQTEQLDSQFYDIRGTPSSDEERMSSIRQTSARMAVGLAAAVVAAGTEEVSGSLATIAEALSLFVSNEFRDEELKKTVEDAKEVILLLKMIGLKTSDAPSTTAASTTKRRTGGDVIAELRRDLDDEMVPVRGEALLRVSRAIKRRERVVLEQLESWLYEKVKEMVGDTDSYVFLSAINALAEVACYDSKKYLENLLQLFLDLGKVEPMEQDTPDDRVLILRGKLAEVIGKVFRCLGDVAPFWLQRAANIFLNALKDESDIIRASSLSAFSDLLLACRGRGMEPILDELFYAVDVMVQNDKSDLVRRAGVHLVRQCIKSCDRSILDVIGGRLRDLRRSLKRLWLWDRDHVVRLHAELCMEELGACLQSALNEETNSMLRIINVK